MKYLLAGAALAAIAVPGAIAPAGPEGVLKRGVVEGGGGVRCVRFEATASAKEDPTPRVGPPAVFFPRPEVESVVFRWTPDPARRAAARERRAAVDLASTAFRKRRKTLANALRGVIDEADLGAAGLDPAARPETVAPDAWLRLARVGGTADSAP